MKVLDPLYVDSNPHASSGTDTPVSVEQLRSASLSSTGTES